MPPWLLFDRVVVIVTACEIVVAKRILLDLASSSGCCVQKLV
jgi:hypothetical protein